MKKYMPNEEQLTKKVLDGLIKQDEQAQRDIIQYVDPSLNTDLIGLELSSQFLPCVGKLLAENKIIKQ
jgi:hypothetical protein